MSNATRQASRRPGPGAARRAALYPRVSTDDRGQDPETQLRQLREYADRRGFEVVEENVDTTTPQGELVFGMMANLAQFESALIGERVRAGMARARAQGKRVSRPAIPEAKRRRLEELWREGRSINSIRKELGIAYGTAWNYVHALGQAER